MYIEGKTLPRKTATFYKTTNHSAITVGNRVNDLGGDIQCQLKEKCIDFFTMFIASDDSIYTTDIALLAMFIPGVNEGFQMVEKFLELIPVKGKTGSDEDFLNV
jgi:hypothetical protein